MVFKRPKAKERDVKFGRKKKLTMQQIAQQIAQMRQRRKQGTLIKTIKTIKTLMKDYDLSLSKASVYRHPSETDDPPSE